MTDLKRRLTDIKFEHEGAHVALVGKHQGGPANGITTLVTKATNAIDQTIVDKATEVTVTLDFEEFLRKFFNMYWEDAEVLARVLGFSDEDEEDDGVDYYKEYIDERVSQINILKSVYRAPNVEKALGELAPAEMLSLLQTQELLEKAMSEALPKGETLKTHSGDSPLDTILKSAHEEAVNKAVADAVAPVQKALDEQTELLKAANEALEVFKAAQVEAVEKARKEAIAAVVPADKVEALFKAYAPMDDEGFELALTVLKAAQASEAQNPLFKEEGANGVGEQDQAKVDKLAEILKAKYPTQGVK